MKVELKRDKVLFSAGFRVLLSYVFNAHPRICLLIDFIERARGGRERESSQATFIFLINTRLKSITLTKVFKLLVYLRLKSRHLDFFFLPNALSTNN